MIWFLYWCINELGHFYANKQFCVAGTKSRLRSMFGTYIYMFRDLSGSFYGFILFHASCVWGDCHVPSSLFYYSDLFWFARFSFDVDFTTTCLYNFDPLSPILKLRFTGVNLFFLFLLQNINYRYSWQATNIYSKEKEIYRGKNA